MLAGNPADGYLVINLGNAKRRYRKEMVTAFEKVTGHPLPKKEMPPRPGDVAGAYANVDTRRLLGWEPKLSIEQAIADALQWGRLRRKKSWDTINGIYLAMTGR